MPLEILRAEIPRIRSTLPSNIKRKLRYLRDGIVNTDKSLCQVSSRSGSKSKSLSFKQRNAIKAFVTKKRGTNASASITKWKQNAFRTRVIREQLHNHEHHHHMSMLNEVVKAGKIAQFKMINDYCSEYCDNYEFDRVMISTSTPYIILAIQHRRLQLVKEMIEMDVSIHVNGPPPYGFRAVIYAGINGDIPMISLLMEHGAILTEHDIHLLKRRYLRYTQTGRTLPNETEMLSWLNKYWSIKLLQAATLNMTDAVLLILAMNEKHFIGNQRDHKRNAPIHVAAKHGNRKMVELLLKHSSKTLNLTNGFGMKPLQIAFVASNLKVAQFLMRKGAVLTKTEFYNTLKSHESNEKTKKMEHLQRFAELIIRATKTDKKAELLPVLCTHLKSINSGIVLWLSQICDILLAGMAFISLPNVIPTPPDGEKYEGPRAISDELIDKSYRIQSKIHRDRRRAAVTFGGNPDILQIRKHYNFNAVAPTKGKRGAKKKKMGENAVYFPGKTPRKIIGKSKSMSELMASNMPFAESTAARMIKYKRSINQFKMKYNRKLDVIIERRRRNSVALGYGNKWRRVSLEK